MMDESADCLIIFCSFVMFSQVRRLVLVESTALFDTAGIDLKPHKAVKVKTKGRHRHRNSNKDT